MQESTLRKQIRSGIKLYYEKFHKKAPFIPGKSRIPYAGRVYDHTEMTGILDSALDFWLTAGPFTRALELKFKKYLNSKSFLLVNSGSSANLVLIAAVCSKRFKNALKPRDEVITPAVTFPTTVGPIVQHGLKPVFVDAKIGTYNIDEKLIEGAVTEKTRAIFIPHTLGNPCDMDIIKRIARKKELLILEDTCDALGSRFDKKLVGTFGAMSSFSFYPAHHITLGEGGGVSINDPGFIKIAQSMRDWGRDCFCNTGESGSCGKRFSLEMGDLPYGYDHKYIYSDIGYNLKITEMQSAIGLAQLDKLDNFVNLRKRNFKRYYDGLMKYSDLLGLPEWHKKADPAWFGFPICVKKGIKRLSLIRWLEGSKIDTRLLFGGNIIKQPAFKNLKCRIPGNLDNTDRIMNDAFFIGVYPGLTLEMIDYVLSRFNAFFKNKENWG